MDWPAVSTTIATAYAGLSDGAGTTLRASHATVPDNIVAPCAVTILRNFRDIEISGNGWMTGMAVYDVLVMLDASADSPRRYAALLRWIAPALIATLSAVQLGLPANVSGAVPGDAEVSPAGESPDYAGMPFDLVRVPILVQFRERMALS